MADNTQAIADIDEILRAGAKQVSNDGTSITHDFDELRRARRALVEGDDTLGKLKRPRVFQTDLSGY